MLVTPSLSKPRKPSSLRGFAHFGNRVTDGRIRGYAGRMDDALFFDEASPIPADVWVNPPKPSLRTTVRVVQIPPPIDVGQPAVVTFELAEDLRHELERARNEIELAAFYGYDGR